MTLITLSLSLQLYFGLLVFVGYIVVDTQDIIEKAHLGDLDYVKHALTLFTDFAAVFVRILIIMVSCVLNCVINSCLDNQNASCPSPFLIQCWLHCLIFFSMTLANNGYFCCAAEELGREGEQEEEKKILNLTKNWARKEDCLVV